MKIRNNSQLDFEVKIQYKNQIKARNLAPNGFLCLNDFYKGHENPANKIREYRVEVTNFYYHEMINSMKRDFIDPDSETTQFDNEIAQPVARRFKQARREFKLVRNVFNQIRRS
ncbi:MAG: hypothetical protein VX777_02160 [Chlamydiota bacterium]|nr:hypothetical protein [Chlamydiota bacterium]